MIRSIYFNKYKAKQTLGTNIVWPVFGSLTKPGNKWPRGRSITKDMGLRAKKEPVLV